MYLIFNQDDQQERGAAYATIPYSSNTENETVVETTEDAIASIFEQAKADGETLGGADESIGAAIDDPLAFLDFLILDSTDTIVFDAGYVRETGDQTSTTSSLSASWTTSVSVSSVSSACFASATVAPPAVVCMFSSSRSRFRSSSSCCFVMSRILISITSVRARREN